MKLSLEKTIAFLILPLSLIMYVKTLAPSVFWWDSGEFIANVSVLGIPHRPGFPLYVLLAKVFAFFAGQNFSWWINLLSAVCASLSLSLVYLTFMRISIDRYGPTRQKVLSSLVGLGVVLVLGFNYSFWIQAVRAEVYSFAFLLFALLFWLTVKTETRQIWPPKAQFLFFAIAGLSLTNHPAIAISTFPALLFLLMTKTSQAWRPKNLFFSILLFLLGISLYLYLPLRSLNKPVFNWLNPADWSLYLSSIFGRESLGHLPQFNRDILLNLFNILKLFIQQMTILPVLLALFGFWSLGPKRRRWLWFALLLTLFNWLTLAVLTEVFIPDNPDLHGYLLPSFLIWSLAFGWGSLYLLNRTYLFFSQPAFTPALKFAVTIVGILFIIFVSAVPLYQSRAVCDLSKNQLPESYARQATKDLPYGSLVIIDNPNLDFLLRGLQYGENFRKDLTVIDRTLLPASWYCYQLKNNYPELFERIPQNLAGEELALNLALKYLNHHKPVFWEFTPKDTSLAQFLLPSGYLHKIVKNPQEYDSLWQQQLVWEQKHLAWDSLSAFQYDGDAQRVWSRVLFNLGYFYERTGHFARAEEKYKRILTLSPDEELVSRRLKQLDQNQVRAQN